MGSRQRRFHSLSVPCLAALLSVLPVSAAATGSAELSFGAAEDAMAVQENPTRNYGRASKLESRGSGNGPTHESFVKFNVSGVAGRKIVQAKVRVFSAAAADAPGITATSPAWSEMFLTWNNRPARRGPVLSDKGPVAKGWLEYDVTSAVQKDGVHSFVFSQNSRHSSSFSSLDNNRLYVPQLVVVMAQGATAPVQPPLPPVVLAPPQPPKTIVPPAVPPKLVPPAIATPNPPAAPVPSPAPSPGATPPGGVAFVPVPCDNATYQGQEFSNHSACKSHSIGLSPSKKVIRFEVIEGDRRDSDSKSGSLAERAELKQRVDYGPGADLWTAFSFMLEEGDATISSSNNLMQWHAALAGTSPPFSLNLYKNNQLHVFTQNDGGKTIQKVTPIERGKWHDMVVHVRFATGGKANGVLEYWLNGEKLLDMSNASIGYAASARNYLKFGIYRSHQSARQVHRFANVEIGTANLQHRTGAPLPIYY